MILKLTSWILFEAVILIFIFHNFQLADIRGNNKKYNLLKFLILQLQQSNPDALNFPDELKNVPKAAACE